MGMKHVQAAKRLLLHMLRHCSLALYLAGAEEGKREAMNLQQHLLARRGMRKWAMLHIP
jgi:hypothetical protein